MSGKATLLINATLTVDIDETDVTVLAGYDPLAGKAPDKQSILFELALKKVRDVFDEQEVGWDVDPQIEVVNDTIDWERIQHPADESFAVEEPYDESDPFKRPPKESLSHKKQAAEGSNPSQAMARDALKIAKELSNLINTLAGLQDRDNIAQIAGLTALPDAVDRLYEYADRMRMGGITDLQQAYAGWDPEKMRKHASPFLDRKTMPPTEVRQPEEQFRFPTQQETCPHCNTAALDVQSGASGCVECV